MRNSKRVYSHGGDNFIRCAWFECDQDGFELYKSVFHEHARGLPCDDPRSEHVNFVFCSERHKQYYLHSHKDLNMLPPGFKTVL